MKKVSNFLTVSWIFLFSLLLLLPNQIQSQTYKDNRPGPVVQPHSADRNIFIDEIQAENRTHDVGSIWMSITNWGYLGNKLAHMEDILIDPCTNDWAPQLEFPGGSGTQYMFQAGLWIGALIKAEGYEYPRVSVGISTEYDVEEMYPGFVPGNGIIERSTRSNSVNCLGDFVSDPEAISEQDFIATYTDTGRYDPLGRRINHDLDGPHIPLGLKITQKSHSWSYNYARDFIIVDYELENIADKYLKNLYIGLYVDGDVGHLSEQDRYEDDICGFQKTFTYLPPSRQDSVTLTINTAWIADNDGRPVGVSSGNVYASPGVTGTRVVRAPNPRLHTSFNWWVYPYGQADDFGPSWEFDDAPGNWTKNFGTPRDDSQKYFILSNREFDFDQYHVDDPAWIAANPQEFHDRFTGEVTDSYDWSVPDVPNLEVTASQADTRYMLSWGPLGIFDYVDESGERVYRLNPGEKFSMTVAFVAGENFHDRNYPQPSDLNIDHTLFNFRDLQYNADWAAKVYDNPMIDTNGDTWYGEDVGLDGIYSENIGDTVSYESWDGHLVYEIYAGPDEGERDGELQQEEDEAHRPVLYDYTGYNQLFDPGDGVPDFQGPPPPPVPVLEYETTVNDVILKWNKYPSENPLYYDPFNRQQDFEGYRIYVSNTGMENEFSFLAEFDRIDFAYYSSDDSLMSIPIETTNPETLAVAITPDENQEFDEIGYLKAVGPNTGLGSIAVDDSSYEFVLSNVSPLMPRYYCITAFDYGDPLTGVEPLETAKTANAVYLAPSGTPRKKPGVVPNPYRADADYTARHMQVVFDIDTSYVSWENRDDGTTDFFPQTDRRIYFYNLPEQCLIRIFTVSGDLIQIIDHNVAGNRIASWKSNHAEAWDLNSRNQQQVVSGLYLFSVEDKTPGGNGHIDVGKFVIIR